MESTDKKYILTDEKTEINGHRVHRIQAIKDFGDVKAGYFGGWVECEENLSQKDLCWVYPNAYAYENSRIRSDAKLYARVIASGECVITDQATLSGTVHVCDHAYITGSPRIENIYKFSSMIIGGNAAIMSNVVLQSSNIKLYRERFKANAQIFRETDYLCVGPIGSRYDYTTFYRTKDQGIWVCCGCFNGSINAFLKAVKHAHPIKSQFRDEYLSAIRLAKSKLEEIKL